MLYIIEGIDGSGKTTLISNVKRFYEVTGRKAIFIKESVTKSLSEKKSRVRRIKQLLNDCPYDVFYDRATVIDDFIYQPLMENKSSELSLEAIDILRKVTIIHIQPDIHECYKRLVNRGDDYIPISREFLASVEKRYTDFYFYHGLTPKIVEMGSNERMFHKVLTIIGKRDFKVAHIVPVEMLGVLKENAYTMCLAHLVKQSEKYTKFYKHFPGYVLMDNGAAENEQLSFDELLSAYSRVEPNEIVIPDTLCNAEDTLRKKDEFFEYIHDRRLPYKMMGVPQGKTFDEWQECARAMVMDERINTIGVSKFLEMETKDPFIRYKAVSYISILMELYGRYDLEVHLLGCSERPDIVKRIHEDYNFVRGCDSALGYLFTKANKKVYGGTSRPKEEIDFINGKRYPHLEETLQDLEIAMGCYDNKRNLDWED